MTGGQPGASCAAPSGGGHTRARALRRARLRSARFPGFRARPSLSQPPSSNVGLGRPSRQALQTKNRAFVKARGSASRVPPSTHPLAKPSRRKLTMSESWSHPKSVSSPCSCHSPAGANSWAPGNRSSPTPALTSCSSFGSEDAAGLAASAPPAGDTVLLQGTPIRHPMLQTPKIPPLQRHSPAWQLAPGTVTHAAGSFADPSLKWATCWTRDLERMGCVCTWQVKSSRDLCLQRDV